jgi:hypothetical protein
VILSLIGAAYLAVPFMDLTSANFSSSYLFLVNQIKEGSSFPMDKSDSRILGRSSFNLSEGWARIAFQEQSYSPVPASSYTLQMMTRSCT